MRIEGERIEGGERGLGIAGGERGLGIEGWRIEERMRIESGDRG